MTWWSDAFDIADASTWTGTLDTRTWTLHGTGSTLTEEGPALRVELANALADELQQWGVAVAPYPTATVSPPQVTIEADSPFMEVGSFGPKLLVWAYQLRVIVPRGDEWASHDWLERVAPQIIDACFAVSGARFETFDAPELEDIGGHQHLVAVGHVTVKRRR